MVENTFWIALLGGVLAAIGAGFAVRFWLGRIGESLPLQLSSSLQKPILDLQERSQRLSVETQERLEKSLIQNRQELRDGLFQATQGLEKKFQSLQEQVSQRLQTIGEGVQNKLNENLKEGFKHFEKVQEHLKAAEIKLAELQTVGQSVSDLNQLLKLPHLRGGFGESSLERILADFLPSGSYELQHMIVPGSTERVDAIVRLSNQVLPIDSKFPREAVLPLFESQNPEDLERARAALAEYIKRESKAISSKYIQPAHGTTNMALLFLPSETLYFEVIRDNVLFQEMVKLKVFPVSPNTLSITLHSVAVAQEYYELARGVEKTIEDIRKARKHFDHFEGRFDEIGKGLRKAQEAYDMAQTHLSRYESSVVRLTGEIGEAPPAELTSPALADPGSAPN